MRQFCLLLAAAALRRRCLRWRRSPSTCTRSTHCPAPAAGKRACRPARRTSAAGARPPAPSRAPAARARRPRHPRRRRRPTASPATGDRAGAADARAATPPPATLPTAPPPTAALAPVAPPPPAAQAGAAAAAADLRHAPPARHADTGAGCASPSAPAEPTSARPARRRSRTSCRPRPAGDGDQLQRGRLCRRHAGRSLHGAPAVAVARAGGAQRADRRRRRLVAHLRARAGRRRRRRSARPRRPGGAGRQRTGSATTGAKSQPP